jgi:hypothetical protein
MAIYYSYRLTKIIKCNCQAYKFPHNCGAGHCRSSLSQSVPIYSPPKKGLGSKLQKILDLYSESENELIQELIQELRGA